MSRTYIPSNKRVRSAESGARSQAHLDTSSRANLGLYKDFVGETQPRKKAKIVNELLRANKQVRELDRIGAMCIEMARADNKRADDWLGKADAVLHEAVRSCALSGLARSAEWAKARRLIGSMPHYYSVLLKGELPSQEWSAKMSEDILKTADDTTGIYRQANSGNKDLQTLRNLKGEIAEQAVHLIGLRAASTIGTEYWSPALSHYSEDHSAQYKKPALLRSWDLTVQTRTAPAVIQDTYLVQVKSSGQDHDDNHYTGYTSDIVVLRVDPDLTFWHEELHPSDIIRDFTLEQQGDQSAHHRLNYRQGKLLDVLG